MSPNSVVLNMMLSEDRKTSISLSTQILLVLLLLVLITTSSALISENFGYSYAFQIY